MSRLIFMTTFLLCVVLFEDHHSKPIALMIVNFFTSCEKKILFMRPRERAGGPGGYEALRRVALFIRGKKATKFYFFLLLSKEISIYHLHFISALTRSINNYPILIDGNISGFHYSYYREKNLTCEKIFFLGYYALCVVSLRKIFARHAIF